ncbi:MAG: hypothetical protein KGJ07_00310 [Patescibacteria group bacterium]|nr:hypothetical protein [Patescibacteria group bacterium]
MTEIEPSLPPLVPEVTGRSTRPFPLPRKDTETRAAPVVERVEQPPKSQVPPATSTPVRIPVLARAIPQLGMIFPELQRQIAAREEAQQALTRQLRNQAVRERVAQLQTERYGRPLGPLPISPYDRSAGALQERGPVLGGRPGSYRGPEYYGPGDATRPPGSTVVYPHGLNAPLGALQERDPNSVRGPGIGRGPRHAEHR